MQILCVIIKKWALELDLNDINISFLKVRRYFPIANLTRTRQAVLVENLRPERFFIRTFNATSLYILSICEVCGSYECPYCPYYSNAISLQCNIITLTFLFVFQYYHYYIIQ